jgi:hypothetical protein
LLPTIEAVDDALPAIGSQHRAEDPQRGRFAGAVVTEEPGDAAVLRFEGDIAHCLHGAEFFASSL